jgi:hypothetical protein
MKLLAALLAAALIAPAGAAASKKPHKPTVKTVIRDCARDGKLSKRYSLTLLRRTRRHLPADVAEYSTCPHVIYRAIKKEKKRLAKQRASRSPRPRARTSG